MSDTSRTDALDESCMTLPTIDRYAIMRSHARKLERVIEEHDRSCDAACNWRCENKSCSYRRPDGTYIYGEHRNCHDCPRDWAIDLNAAPQENRPDALRQEGANVTPAAAAPSDFERLWQESRLSNSQAEIYKADIEDLVRVAVERACERQSLADSIAEQNNAGRYSE